MSHGDFVRPGGQWPAELVPGAQDAQRLDELQRRSINGDLGGTWNPKQPVVIGGAGTELGSASYFFGGVTTRTGGRLIAPAAPVINDIRSQVLTVPVRELGLRVQPNLSLRFDACVARPGTRRGVSFNQGQVPGLLGLTIPRRYLHDQQKLVTVAIEFFITRRPGSVPALAMKMVPQEHAYDGTLHPCTPSTIGGISWASGVAHALGDYIMPSSQAHNNGYYFKASTITGAGHTGATEPNWASLTSVGQTINDYATPGTNGVVWTMTGRSGWLSTLGATVDSYYANGAAQLLALDPDPASTFGMNKITNQYDSATVQVEYIDPLAVITGLQLSYAVSSMAFE